MRLRPQKKRGLCLEQGAPAGSALFAFAAHLRLSGSGARLPAGSDGQEDKGRAAIPKHRQSSGRGRNFLIALVSILLLGFIAYLQRSALQRAAIFRQSAELLVSTDPVEKADILYLLNGDHRVRPYWAAHLFYAGMAPKIVIPWVKNSPIEPTGIIWNESEVNRTALRMYGIPDARVEEFHFTPGVTSTFDEARALLSYAQLHGVRKVIVVTSEWHSRRTRWIMRRLLSPSRIAVMVTAQPDPQFRIQWWSRRSEYLKLLYYWLRYRLPISQNRAR